MATMPSINPRRQRDGRIITPRGDFVLPEEGKVIMYSQMHMRQTQKIEI